MKFNLVLKLKISKHHIQPKKYYPIMLDIRSRYLINSTIFEIIFIEKSTWKHVYKYIIEVILLFKKCKHCLHQIPWIEYYVIKNFWKCFVFYLILQTIGFQRPNYVLWLVINTKSWHLSQCNHFCNMKQKISFFIKLG